MYLNIKLKIGFVKEDLFLDDLVSFDICICWKIVVVLGAGDIFLAEF